jgi:threonine/homoserine/homoserine lactone efflux protein
MSAMELGLAVLVLLLTPGPTNTLMLLAGAEQGVRGALRLIPAEVLGYALPVLPLTLIGASLLADQQALRAGVTLAAGVWVAVLAVRLWQVPASGLARSPVGPRAVFVTTALNPKALIFGLVLLPAPDRLAGNLALFFALVVLVAVVWARMGAALADGSRQPRALVVLRRLASVWLALVSLALMARGVAA